MTPNLRPDHPLRRLFDGLVEQVFMTEMGICRPSLTDYLGQMLSEFVHFDQIFRMRTVDGEAIRDLSRVHAEAYLGPHVDEGTRARVLNRYVGDFTLFWSGVYPEVLRLPRPGVERLHEYLIQGKRSYGIASELSEADANPPAELLRELSVQFECCVHGLHLVREGWERLGRPASHN